MSIDFDAFRPRLAELCRRYGIAELSVFGSVARGGDGPDSDLDLLYVRAPGSIMGSELFTLRDELQKLFGRRVDLILKDYLHWIIRDRVIAEARALYAA